MRKKWHQGLAARVNLFIVCAILATSGGIACYFVLAERHQKEQYLVTHGVSVASMMAVSAQHGLITNDLESLAELFTGIDADVDIVYAGFFDEEGNPLIHRSRNPEVPLPLTRAWTEGTAPEKPSHRGFVGPRDGLRYMEILVPVEPPAWMLGGRAASSGGRIPRAIGYVRLVLDRERVEGEIRKFLESVAVATTLLVIAGVGLALLLTKKIVSPIRELADVANSMSEENLDRQVAVEGTTELSDLARSFNDMLSRLRGSRDQLRRQSRELQAVNERFSLLLRSLPIVVYSCEAEGDYNATYVSGNIAEIAGYRPEDFFAAPGFWSKNIHPDDSPKVFAALEMLPGKGSHTHEYRWKTSDGSYVWFRDSVRLVAAGNGRKNRIVGVWEDISRQMEGESVRALLGMAVEQAGETIMITDTEGTIQYVNPAFEQISGYRREEVIGLKSSLLRSGEHKEDFYEELWRTISGGCVWSGTFVNRKKDGTAFHEVAVISPVRDATGTIVNYVAGKRDVTNEVKLEEQLRQSQKMEAIGRLAGGIAHDFNNLLTAITGYSEILLARLGQGDPARKEIEEIRAAGNRAASLTRQLLAFGRKQVFELRVVDLNETILNMDGMLRRLIGEDIRLRTIPGEDLGMVQVDSGQIEQVVMNLVVNARDAMPGGGEIDIATSNVDPDGDSEPRVADAHPGECVMLSVRDSGVGMGEEIKSRIFEPFFTTKEKGKGTGLGLSTVYGIVTQSGGHIRVCSEPGMGSTFEVYFPRTRHCEEKVGQAGKITGENQRGCETLLLAEDEDVVRDLIRRVLGKNGYKVLVARNGTEALAIAEEHADPIHLLLTDVVMPQMSGRELVDRFRRKHPETGVLYMSGYPGDEILRYGGLEPGTAFVQKPFQIALLEQKVREVLDGRGRG